MTKKISVFGLIIIYLSFFFISTSENISGDRVLVLLDNLAIQQSYSQFFNSLRSRGYKLSFFAADDPTLTLTEYGEYLYDQLIIFALEEFGGLVDVPSILDFIDEGHNVLIATDSSVSDPVREIALECGVEFDEEGSYVIDHFHSSDQASDHSTIKIKPSNETVLTIPVVTGSTVEKGDPILFKGIGQSINEVSGLNFAILRGYDTTYSANPDKPIGEDFRGKIGKETVLVSALQARNNARVLFSGSLLLFSDQFFRPTTGNQYLATELSKWVFKERGLLRARNISHHKVGETVPPQMYTVKEDITYSVIIEEWDGSKWVPFVSDNVQLEFTMLDPYLRTFLKPDKKTGLFSVTFKIPDVYGVFSFKINYNQLGYTSISLKTIHPVRPFRHDEYERFIKTALPYYVSSTSMLVGVFILTVVLLFSKV